MNVVVVGASSGLGRCIAVGLGNGGARVGLLARRKERLADAAAEAGSDAVAIPCDVTDEESCRAAIAEAARELGSIDALVYAAGVGTLVKLADTDAATWHRTLETNVIGAALITAAALPHLAASQGTAAYLSSISASQTPPWPGLGAYSVSKAALDKLVEAWQIEHPQIAFTRVTVGDCAGGEGDAMTGFSSGWDMDLMGELAPIWVERQFIAGALLEVGELVRVIDHLVRSGPSVHLPAVTVVPRRPG